MKSTAALVLREARCFPVNTASRLAPSVQRQSGARSMICPGGLIPTTYHKPTLGHKLPVPKHLPLAVSCKNPTRIRPNATSHTINSVGPESSPQIVICDPREVVERKIPAKFNIKSGRQDLNLRPFDPQCELAKSLLRSFAAIIALFYNQPDTFTSTI